MGFKILKYAKQTLFFLINDVEMHLGMSEILQALRKEQINATKTFPYNIMIYDTNQTNIFKGHLY